MYCVVRQKLYLLCVTFVRPNGVPRNPWVRKEIPFQYKILCFFNLIIILFMLLLLSLVFCYSLVNDFVCLFSFAFSWYSFAVCVIGLVPVVPAHKL